MGDAVCAPDFVDTSGLDDLQGVSREQGMRHGHINRGGPRCNQQACRTGQRVAAAGYVIDQHHRAASDSQLGQGSRFWLELPLLAEAAPAPQGLPTADQGLVGLRVLVAEDQSKAAVGAWLQSGPRAAVRH